MERLLAMATPSILQQRIVLVVFLIAIGILAWWQNADRYASHPVRKFSQTFVVDGADGLDFTRAEAGWSSLHIDSQGHLQIDALTESALLDSIALLHDPTSERVLARMPVLLEKQFGATASRQIMELLPVLKKYKEMEQRWWTENGSRNSPPYAELFHLQDELFGATLAKQMFSEHRRLASMMLARQRIRSEGEGASSD